MYYAVTAVTPSHIKQAQNLHQSAAKFGIDVSIVEIDSVHRSISPKGSLKSHNTKAKIILDYMAKVSGPVLWLDGDLTIEKSPFLFNKLARQNIDLAIYNWLGDEANAALRPIKFPDQSRFSSYEGRFFENAHEVPLISSSQLFCSGAVQFWNYTKRSIGLLKRWNELALTNPFCQDDHLLDAAFNYHKKSLNLFSLPKEYCRIAFWPHVEPTINHKDFPYGGGDWADTDTALRMPRLKKSEIVRRPHQTVVPEGYWWDNLTKKKIIAGLIN